MYKATFEILLALFTTLYEDEPSIVQPCGNILEKNGMATSHIDLYMLSLTMEAIY